MSVRTYEDLWVRSRHLLEVGIESTSNGFGLLERLLSNLG